MFSFTSLSAQCPPGHRKYYLVSVTSTIIIIQYRFCSKTPFLFSFSFYSGCSLGRGSHCVFPATPCIKNCMYRIPTLWYIYPISSEVALPLSNQLLWARGHWGSRCELEDELQVKPKARVRVQSDHNLGMLSTWVMTMWSCRRLRCPVCTQGTIWLRLQSKVL